MRRQPNLLFSLRKLIKLLLMLQELRKFKLLLKKLKTRQTKPLLPQPRQQLQLN
jgi:hypothetical protein